MSPWRHIPYDRLSPELRKALTILNRRWVIVWLLTIALGLALPLYLNNRQNDHRLAQIQQERAYNIVRTCRDTNMRRANAFRTLDSLLAQRVADHPALAAQARQSRDSTRLLIASLVPKQDCDALARTRVSR